MLKAIIRHYFTERTILLVRLDWWRFLARRKTPSRAIVPNTPRLHLACGTRRVPGWLNVDMGTADVTIDVMNIPWPFPDAAFSEIVCQHMIEHFELESELLPILREIRRIAKPGAELWMSTPDLEMMCKAYVNDKGAAVKQYMVARDHGLCGDQVPSQQYINLMFHALGHHRNLLDLELLTWALEKTGWSNISRVKEADLLKRFPEFPARNDGFESLAVLAIAK